VRKQSLDEMRDGIMAEMEALQSQRGYASLLLMIVDIVHGETEILVQGMEQAVAEALGQSLVAPHSVIVGGVLSRKKQIVPILPIVARGWKGHP
jgi:manganese-dependent inorganic pyrophosphatase